MDIRAFEKRVIDYSAIHGLFVHTGRCLLAVSGGADSTALLHVLYRCEQHGFLQQAPLCIHFNHQLRQSASLLDEHFIRARADSLGMEFECQKINVKDYARQHQVSLETAARELRLDRLAILAKARNCTVIATGHHQDDNAETVLQRLARGTGFRGLAGIWPKRIIKGVSFISPLLCVGRAEIRAYLRARQLTWRDDTSNTDCSIRRNFIRHQLLPTLQGVSVASLPRLLAGLSTPARKLHEQVKAHIAAVYPQLTSKVNDHITLHQTGFIKEPEIIQIELIRTILVDLGCGEGNLSAKHYQRVIQLARSRVGGKHIQLPQGFAARKQYDNLIFSPPPKKSVPKPQFPGPTELAIPGSTEFGPYTISTSISETAADVHARLCRKTPSSARERAVFSPGKDGEAGDIGFIVDAAGCSQVEKGPLEARSGFPTEPSFQRKSHGAAERLDWDKLQLPITVRLREPGDRFRPLGRGTPQKISKFLINAKIPPGERDRVLVLMDTSKVIWVCPARISEDVKITPETKRIIKIEVQSGRPKTA